MVRSTSARPAVEGKVIVEPGAPKPAPTGSIAGRAFAEARLAQAKAKLAETGTAKEAKESNIEAAREIKSPQAERPNIEIARQLRLPEPAAEPQATALQLSEAPSKGVSIDKSATVKNKSSKTDDFGLTSEFETYSNGATRSIQKARDGRVTEETINNPDGSSKTTYYNADGSSYFKETIISHNAEGHKIATTTLPSGAKEMLRTDQNGIELERVTSTGFNSSSRQINYPNGKPKLIEDMNGDGSHKIEKYNKDGSSTATITNKDGSLEIYEYDANHSITSSKILSVEEQAQQKAQAEAKSQAAQKLNLPLATARPTAQPLTQASAKMKLKQIEKEAASGLTNIANTGTANKTSITSFISKIFKNNGKKPDPKVIKPVAEAAALTAPSKSATVQAKTTWVQKTTKNISSLFGLSKSSQQSAPPATSAKGPLQ